MIVAGLGRSQNPFPPPDTQITIISLNCSKHGTLQVGLPAEEYGQK